MQMQLFGRKCPNLRSVLERGPLGALSVPETGFVWDAASEVWQRLSLADKVALYMAAWPFSKHRWHLLAIYSQGGRFEYGPMSTNTFGFGEHTSKRLAIVGLGFVTDTCSWQALPDYEQLAKLFALLQRNGEISREKSPGSRSVDAWRRALVNAL
jgi:hypothetical protein